jgi:hypothetical protein
MQSYVLYRACIIYSHTSMWASQQLETGAGDIPEVSQCVREIIELAREIISNGHLERKYIVFPLFMAGIAATSAADREQALEFLGIMEQDSVGRNMGATKHLLNAVYEKQREGFIRVGYALDVDWIQIVRDMGLQVVSCRL